MGKGVHDIIIFVWPPPPTTQQKFAPPTLSSTTTTTTTTGGRTTIRLGGGGRLGGGVNSNSVTVDRARFMHCTEGAAARWWGGLAGLENNNTAAWREEEIGYKKKKKTPKPGAGPRRQRTAYFRKSRARGRGIDTNTGPDAAATHTVSTQSCTHRPKRSPCNTAAAVVDTVLVVVVVVVVVVVIVIVGCRRTVRIPSSSAIRALLCTAENQRWRATDNDAAPVLLVQR